MSERLRGISRAGSVCMAIVLLVAGCADGRAGNGTTSGAVDDTDDLATGEVASESEEVDDLAADEVASGSDGAGSNDDFGEPRPEETTEEAPADVEIDPTSIEVATLPIGGSADEAGEDLQCVDVGWSEPPEIPTGVTVVIQDLVLEPAGHFELSDQPCPGDAPPCLPDHAVTPEQRCTVAVGWTETAGDDGGSLSAAGTIVCAADPDVCSTFGDAVAERGGAAIELLPPLPGTNTSGNGEAGEGSGSSGQDGEQREDPEQNGAEATHENGRGSAEENGVEDAPENGPGNAEQDGEEDTAEDTAENGEG